MSVSRLYIPTNRFTDNDIGILASYAAFLEQVTKFNILEAHTFKPLVTGTELAKALNTKPGPWMKDALDVVMAWQLRNPNITDPTKAIHAVKASREENKNSELPSCLVSHFLQLTVRPLFSQAKSNPNLTPAGHKAPARDQRSRFPDDAEEPWKDPKNASAIDLLRWSISALDTKGVEANWGVLVPPILKMIDDISLEWKATGCEMLTLLLKSTPPSLLSRTGLGNVFEDSLWPLFMNLPTLTIEQDSILLLDRAFPALIALIEVLHPASSTAPTSSLSTAREKFLDRILRDGILAPLFHAPPSSYPKLATTLISHLPHVSEEMGLNSVKHLQSSITLLSNILAEPLGLTYPPLMNAAAKGIQAVILNAWPRIQVHQGEVVRGVCLAWIRCYEEEEKGTQGITEVVNELKKVCSMLDAVYEAEVDELSKEVWQRDKEELVRVDARLAGMFDG